MPDPTPPVVVEARNSADSCVIWLHGLGADGHDFEPLVPALSPALQDHTRFVFPHAPMLPVTINGGYLMRAWYDIRDSNIEDRADRDGVMASELAVQELIQEQIDNGIAGEKILLAGFSQGGAIVLHSGLRYHRPLAGILALSTYLPLPDECGPAVHTVNSQIPIFMAHGQYDAIVPLSLARQSQSLLTNKGYTVQWRDYPMEHSVCPAQVEDISAWLLSVLR